MALLPALWAGTVADAGTLNDDDVGPWGGAYEQLGDYTVELWFIEGQNGMSLTSSSLSDGPGRDDQIAYLSHSIDTRHAPGIHTSGHFGLAGQGIMISDLDDDLSIDYQFRWDVGNIDEWYAGAYFWLNWGDYPGPGAVEGYIIETWEGRWGRPALDASEYRATYTADGMTYDVYEHYAPGGWRQWWAVAAEERHGGVISYAEHLKAWMDSGMGDSEIDRVAVFDEPGGWSDERWFGTAEFTSARIDFPTTGGGSDTSGDPAPTNPPNGPIPNDPTPDHPAPNDPAPNDPAPNDPAPTNPPADPGDDAAATPVLMESGEVQVGHEWQWVAFAHAWDDPVVVAGPASANGSDPVTVRIYGTSGEGFWIRLQEWDYLDGWHAEETVAWTVTEAGSRLTEDGRRIEAGTVKTNRTGGFRRKDFESPFDSPPVVLTTVASDVDRAAVTSRIRSVDATGFDIGLREEEAADQSHQAETLNYIAITPGAGDIGGLWVEVGRSGDAVTHAPYTLAFESEFAAAPLLLAGMQTTDGGDPATLRWDFATDTALDLWLDEEWSKDSERWHTTENVGYLLVGALPESESPVADGVVYEDAEDGTTDGWSVYSGSGKVRNVADEARGGRAIALQGSGTSTGYRLLREDGRVWNGTEGQLLSWGMRFGESFRMYVYVATNRGDYYLEYSPSGAGDDWTYDNYIHHGLDPQLTDGAWHTVKRDLAADLRDADPRLELLAVNAFLVRGSGRVDDITLLGR